MLNELRRRAIRLLAAHQTCVLTTSGAGGAWAMPVRCRSQGLAVECLLPRWADAAYFVEQDPDVLLLIEDGEAPASRWLQIEGVARVAPDSDWAAWLPAWASPVHPSDLYLVLRVSPRRVELFDEGRGWGAREGVEI